MKITILNGSPRKGGNTETMVNEFARGAKEAGHETEILPVGQMDIHGCLGCKYCFAHGGECVQKDDMQKVLASIDQADMVVFAAPVYWFDVTAQLKCAIDRMYARGGVGFHFNKTALLLNSGSDGVYEAAIAQYKMMGGYLKWEDKGIITIPGMESKTSMKESKALEDVYKFGLSL
ncbi:NADPH-dependent FMN reductase [Lachnospiraceae bacterium TWA4]|nr:NADPH-dependent FMN reductase [Lachnospiraceae bacterium TWA4]